MQALAAPAQQKGRKSGAQVAEAACQQLQLRHDIMRNLNVLYELLLAKGVLPATHDLKAAEQLVRSTAIGCLVQPPQHSDKASKAVEEALRQSCTGWWADPCMSAFQVHLKGLKLKSSATAGTPSAARASSQIGLFPEAQLAPHIG
jgi:hypothetical protein